MQVGQMERAYRARVDSVITFYQTRVAPDYSQGHYTDIAANLHRGTNLDWALARLDTLMQAPTGDMFWMYPFLTVMLAGQDVLPDDTKRRMRDLWRTYRPYRGDTENHWLLYYSTLYLVNQMYPDEPGETWFTGKSSQENFDEAEEWLIEWMDLTTTKGRGEYDSAHYIKVYTAPLALLYGWAEDPEMRQRAWMMLEYEMADYAVELLAGHYGGAHSRVYEREALAPGRSPAVRYAGLFFGQAPLVPSLETMMVAMSGYEPSPILHGIASDRSAPYAHRELKRTRLRMRHSDHPYPPVYKYSFVRPEYILGSRAGGFQPIQEQGWGLQWAASDRIEARNTFLALHPYSSPEVLGMNHNFMQEFITVIVIRSKTEYDSPDKLTGGSPYEQLFQDEDALIALYDIEPGVRFEHINAHFSADLENVVEDESGWIFARGGDALIAVYPLQPYRWEDKLDYLDDSMVHQRLVSPHLQNGLVVQVAPASAYPSMDAFQDAVRALPLETSTDPVARVRFTALNGRQLEAAFGETPSIDGERVDYENWPLFDGPFAQAAPESRQLELRYGAMRRLLDFNTLTVRDWIETPQP
ncbi:MAG: hypothetical protein Rubg2KO_21350 [Rubricoccaceae bacterium]